MNFFDSNKTSFTLPVASNKAIAKDELEMLLKSEGPLAKLAEDSYGKQLLESLFGNSPYLTTSIKKENDFFKAMMKEGFDPCWKQIQTELEQFDFTGEKKEVMSALRVFKRRFALLTAVADITEKWTLEQVTEHLSVFATKALQICVNHILHKAHAAGKIVLKDEKNPSEACGYVIFAVGKLGSDELNYSSDIDIIAYYDANKVDYQGRQPVSHFFINMTHTLAEMMQERTQDGYVFRTDLRLRPDPASTPPAIAIRAAEIYYETVGQNWERAAMIKAKPVAGDMEVGKEFMTFLERYVWRKYLDFTSLQDIHSIKRQIATKQGRLPENLLGYNIKLGQGGIREIEFYAQTQQLVWGGREVLLRTPATCPALQRLAAIAKISEPTAAELTDAYRFYRIVEHRLQMINDQQTHTLPKSLEEMEKLALFMNFADTATFIDTLTFHINIVQAHYSKLFESSPPLASDIPGVEGSLVFTGVDDDPETLQTLEKMGFSNPQMVSEIIRGWHYGRRRATRTKRARELITELMPSILLALSKAASPDNAFTKFDEFLSHLPAGVQIFSLFHAELHLLDLVAELLGGYPYMAESLTRKPALIEYVLSSDFYTEIPDPETLNDRLKHALKQARDFEEVLNITRSWTHDRQFRIGVQIIKNKLSPEEACQHLSNLADVVLNTLFTHVMKDFAKKHGTVNKDCFAIIAMGKLGGRELTFSSDLDIVFVYDEGQYPHDTMKLPAAEYFMRLCRRITSAVTSLTQEGRLYEIDTRLRPSGNDGPVACSLSSFDNYYATATEENSAWEWEYMALTRARVIVGSKVFSRRLRALINQKLQKPWDIHHLARRAVEMRERVAYEFSTTNPFVIKYVRGGLVDVEFINQYLQLVHATKNPEILDQSTINSFVKMVKMGVLDAEDGNVLIEAASLYLTLQCMLRLTATKDPDEATMTVGLKKNIAQIFAIKDFDKLKKRLVETEKKRAKPF